MNKDHFQNIVSVALNGFGDTILATGLYRAIRQAYPNAHLTALAMWPSTAALLRSLGTFDEVIHHNFFRASLSESLRVIHRLRQRRFDLAVLPFPTNRAHYNLLARAIGARERLGHEYLLGGNLPYARFLLTQRVNQMPGMHVVEENRKLAAALGADTCDYPDISIGTLGLDEQPWAARFLAGHPQPYIGLHPGCCLMKNHARRRWPAERYATLAKLLWQNANGTPLIFLGPEEQSLVPLFEQHAPHAIIVTGQSISRVAALIRQCDLFVNNDSSLGHLAAACKIPCVQILGPTNPAYIRPWGVPHRIVSQNLPCSPCFEYGRHPLRCPAGKDFACVNSISVQEVYSACRDLLAETTPLRRRHLGRARAKVQDDGPGRHVLCSGQRARDLVKY